MAGNRDASRSCRRRESVGEGAEKTEKLSGYAGTSALCGFGESKLHNNHFQKPQLSVSRAVLGLTAFNLPITTTNPEFCVPPNRISLRVNLVMMYKCTALKPTVYFPFGPTYRYRLIHPCFSIFGRFVKQCNHLVPTRRFGVNLPTAV